MERECHQLDLKLAQQTTGDAGDRVGFLTYSALIHEITALGEEEQRAVAHAEMLDGAITTIALQIDPSSSDSNSHLRELRQEALRTRQRISELVSFCRNTHIYVQTSYK